MKVLEGQLQNKGWKIGVVTSRFNAKVTDRLEEGAFKRLKELDFSEASIMAIRVPGAVEIPLAAKWLLESGCDAVVALGAVIRGETSHYDYVCNSVERGCSQLALDFDKPVAFGVLTTENAQQAFDRVGGNKGHKGEEAVDVVVELLSLKQELKS